MGNLLDTFIPGDWQKLADKYWILKLPRTLTIIVNIIIVLIHDINKGTKFLLLKKWEGKLSKRYNGKTNV